MAQVIKLKEAINRRKTSSDQDLTTLLKNAVLLRKSLPVSQGDIMVTGFKKLKTLFEVKISEILFKWQFIDMDFFLCGNYVSGLLTGIADKVPESWFAIDYILKSNETNNPHALKQGANICFLICSIFKGRSELRTMRYEDYEKMGISLFSQFYCQTGSEIGYHMSKQYRIMVRVTGECLRTI